MRVAIAAKHVRNYLVSWVAAWSWSRGLLNAVYIRLTPAQREAFHRELSNIFRNSSLRASDGRWEVMFAGKMIRIPLASEQFWLDWGTALSVVGQDMAVRKTYEALIRSPERPDLFIDIGTNYGTHSLLFLVHQVRTLSFEPNSSCHDYFKRLCAANQVTPHLEPVALGEQAGWITLSYPKSETWLGSVNSDVTRRLALTQELVSTTVEQRMLDDYMHDIGNSRTLIKIDTEGHELSVLRGAVRVLEENRPIIIFECWNDVQRLELEDFLDVAGYQICNLPWDPIRRAQPLTSQGFLASSSTNFVALPFEIISSRTTF